MLLEKLQIKLYKMYNIIVLAVSDFTLPLNKTTFMCYLVIENYENKVEN